MRKSKTRANESIGLILIMILVVNISSETHQSSSGHRFDTKTLQFVSPLQSLTIFPKEDIIDYISPRDEYLEKLKAGLSAEERVRESIALERGRDVEKDDVEYVGPGWDKKSLEKEKSRREKEELRIEQAFDVGIRKYEKLSSKAKLEKKKEITKSSKRSEYQFVGVIQPTVDENMPMVKWYARKRPSDQSSKWNVRLIHVNRDAIIRDLFVQGKVDVYGQYINTGKFAVDEGAAEIAPVIGKPLIEGKYSVRERSWRTLWNFNPLHFFADSSGAFWRERRLSPGLYTDGNLVYESIYRYSDGKNGMKPVSVLDDFMKSKMINKGVKKRLLKKLKLSSPDVVLEE